MTSYLGPVEPGYDGLGDGRLAPPSRRSAGAMLGIALVLICTGFALFAPGLARAVAPTVSVSPVTGSPGTGLTVSGSGWPAGDEVFVQIGSATFDNDVVCVLIASSTGKISGTQAANGCVIPNVPNGTQPLVGIDDEKQGVISHSTFHVT